MATDKESMMKMDPKDVFGGDVENLDAGLKEINITIGIDWVKARKAYELCKALEQAQNIGDMPDMESDSNTMMIKMFQMMHQQAAEAAQAAEKRQAAQM